MKDHIKKVAAFLLLASLMLFSFSCSNSEKTENEVISAGENEYTVTSEKTNIILIEVEGYGNIIFEMYPEIAPITVANFQKLVSEKFYDGIIFHRVMQNFMIQTGDPTGTGSGGSNDLIKGEFAANGVENTLSHTKGTVSMARRTKPLDSASSQFFICSVDYPSLDGYYAAFGRVTYGIEIVEAISNVKTNANDRPEKDIKMKRVRFLSPKN